MSVRYMDDVASGNTTDLITLIMSAIKTIGMNISTCDGQLVVTPQQCEFVQGIDVDAIEAEIIEANEWDIATANKLADRNYVLALRVYCESITWSTERVRHYADMLEQLYE